jgi:mono/diheme cytochrome c family protein/plastocyanin
MNTRKQVLLMSALLMMMLVITGLYAAWYPSRAKDSEEHFDELQAERGAILFASNCRLCHGNLGEGGALGGRLAAAPALDRPDFQAFTDSTATLAANVNSSATSIRVSNGSRFAGGQLILIGEERMEITGTNGTELTVKRAQGHTEAASHASGDVIYTFSDQLLNDIAVTGLHKLLTNTITCGRVGTAMPAWAQSQGGTLSDEQIQQLVTLITLDRWDLVEEQINLPETAQPHPGDRIDVRLLTPLSADAAFMQVSDRTLFTDEEVLRIGEERVRVKGGVPARPTAAPGQPTPTPIADKSGELQIERGILGTTPLDHPVDEPIYRFAEVATPSTNQQSCGQTARAPVEAAPPGLIEPFDGQTVTVVAQNVAFDTREIRVSSGPIRLRLDNRDNGTQHNIAVRKSATDTAPAFTGSVGTTFEGVNVDDTVFTATPAGTYFFRCDVHPTTMTGSFIVQ